jgi:uncharacterized protein YoxC
MPTVVNIADLSLAVIALAVAVAVVALVPALVQVRRTAARAEEVLGGLADTLPGLLRDVQAIVHKLDGVADTLQTLATSVDRLDRFAATTARTVEGVREMALAVAREMLMPSVANAAGILAMLREGMQWLRPRRDDKRREEP